MKFSYLMLPAKIGFVTAENEPSDIWYLMTFAYLLLPRFSEYNYHIPRSINQSLCRLDWKRWKTIFGPFNALFQTRLKSIDKSSIHLIIHQSINQTSIWFRMSMHISCKAWKYSELFKARRDSTARIYVHRIIFSLQELFAQNEKNICWRKQTQGTRANSKLPRNRRILLR